MGQASGRMYERLRYPSNCLLLFLYSRRSASHTFYRIHIHTNRSIVPHIQRQLYVQHSLESGRVWLYAFDTMPSVCVCMCAGFMRCVHIKSNKYKLYRENSWCKGNADDIRTRIKQTRFVVVVQRVSSDCFSFFALNCLCLTFHLLRVRLLYS